MNGLHTHLKIVVLAAVMLLFTGQPLSAYAQSDGENADRLKTVNQDIGKLKGLLQQIQQERSSLQTSLQKTEKELSKTHQDIRHLERQLNQARENEKKYQTEQQQLEVEKKSGQKAVETAIRAAYKAGQESRLKLLLNQEDPELTSRMTAYYDYFSKAQLQTISELQSTSNKLAQAEQKLTSARLRIESNRSSLQQQEQELSKQNKQRRNLLDKAGKDEKNNSQQLAGLELEKEELQKLLSAILTLDDVDRLNKPFRKVRGQLPWPVKGRVLHNYGERKLGNTLRWNGLFIQASAGTNVKAPYHGQVIFADWLQGFGLLMILNHGNGYMSLYAHNQSLLRDVGEWVVPGTDIALVGNTGGQSRPGLYFEIRYNGKPANPRTWLMASR